MWHVTCDTWHFVTRDMFGGVNILSKFQLPSSYGLWFMISWSSRGKGSRSDWMNDEGVSRTAQATPGLLKILNNSKTCQRMKKIRTYRFQSTAPNNLKWGQNIIFHWEICCALFKTGYWFITPCALKMGLNGSFIKGAMPGTSSRVQCQELPHVCNARSFLKGANSWELWRNTLEQK